MKDNLNLLCLDQKRNCFFREKERCNNLGQLIQETKTPVHLTETFSSLKEKVIWSCGIGKEYS
jgi:hypothetical protein